MSESILDQLVPTRINDHYYLGARLAWHPYSFGAIRWCYCFATHRTIGCKTVAIIGATFCFAIGGATVLTGAIIALNKSANPPTLKWPVQ